MYKDILVHLDGGHRDAIRIKAAGELAKRFGGRLTGLFARAEHQGLAVIARRGSEAFEQAATESEHQFAETVKDLGIVTRWWRLAHGEQSHVLAETAIAARFHDLVIVGQHHADKDAPEDLIEQLVLQSGRPVLILPAVDTYPTIGTNVMVAWNGGREASRALHDAMPLLEGAGTVEIVSVRAQQRSPDAVLPPLNIVEHLAQHGAKVTREVLAGEDIGVMDLLLSRTFDQGCDLLVMGGHGGYHLPFFKGAGTRHILKHMTLPVLMSH
ncbi:MAG: universal stress protein [Magnetospirillum gryphiswaldense]|nr:universal stress protein [Magnetospirillum gryphiswaldense]